jgi:sphinganine C4-monooxygenase
MYQNCSYKYLHPVHHRLYVPYAFSMLYHPVEGFLLDTLDALPGLTTRVHRGLLVCQAMLFFVLSTCKTVDDHYNYNLPFGRLQVLSSNTTNYHDVHHQVINSIPTVLSLSHPIPGMAAR